MAAPKKPRHKLKARSVYVYVDDSLFERLKAESERLGGRSYSDLLRGYANERLPLPSLGESIPKINAQ